MPLGIPLRVPLWVFFGSLLGCPGKLKGGDKAEAQSLDFKDFGWAKMAEGLLQASDLGFISLFCEHL